MDDKKQYNNDQENKDTRLDYRDIDEKKLNNKELDDIEKLEKKLDGKKLNREFDEKEWD